MENGVIGSAETIPVDLWLEYSGFESSGGTPSTIQAYLPTTAAQWNWPDGEASQQAFRGTQAAGNWVRAADVVSMNAGALWELRQYGQNVPGAPVQMRYLGNMF